MPARRSRRTKRPTKRSLVEALTDPACYDHGVGAVTVAETHISWVFLTGQFAYKVKKPVKLPFLDFSTLRRRRHFCEQELRLNRRLAPQLYLDVVPIGGSAAAPRIGREPAIEYAVKMRQFPATARLDRCLEAGNLTRAAMTTFAAHLADFHSGLPALSRDPRGKAARTAALANFTDLEAIARRPARPLLQSLQAWTERQCTALADTFAARAAAGAHRECHGDLHLENLLLQGGEIVAYDALEFDPQLREIDTVSEVSFLAMDLVAHGRSDLAFAFLNRYFEAGGDYGGIDVLRFYLVYRAVVRAKVQAIKAAQGQGAKRRDPKAPYLATAQQLAMQRVPLLLITHGLSGSGKTYVTEELVARLPALRVRSDLERKRLHGFDAAARTGSGVGEGLYSADASGRTYAALGRSADRALRRGFNAIVDATFLRRAEREAFRQIAAANGARFAILDCTAPTSELRRRVTARAAEGRDASEANLAVLERQLRDRQPLGPGERGSVIRVDTRRRVRYAALLKNLATR